MNFYQKADILKAIMSRKGNFKTLLYSKAKELGLSERQHKQTYSILVNICKRLNDYQKVYKAILRLLDQEEKKSCSNFYVFVQMLHEFIRAGYRPLRFGGKAKTLLLKHKD